VRENSVCVKTSCIQVIILFLEIEFEFSLHENSVHMSKNTIFRNRVQATQLDFKLSSSWERLTQYQLELRIELSWSLSTQLNSNLMTDLTVSLFLSLLFLDELMNLSFVIIIIQDKTLIISEIKKICNKWKLCYYCKLQHLSKITKECSNKKLFTLHIMNVYDNDVVSINEEVSLFAKKV